MQQVKRGVISGLEMAGAAACTMALSSTIARGSPWAGFNAMATGVGVTPKYLPSLFHRTDDSLGRNTWIGLGVLTTGLVVWGLGFEVARAVPRRRGPAVVAGLLSGVLAFAFDRLVMPRWLVPNFARKMGVAGSLAKYAVIGVVSAARAGLFARSGLQPVEMAPAIEHRTTLPFGVPAYLA